MGSDFGNDDFNLYHATRDRRSGFPVHPHRALVTFTLVRKGLIDHHDSLGNSGRFGNGDAQWMIAGRGIQHSEIFPLLKKDEDNPMELFQIWLAMPHADFDLEPTYEMLWAEDVPHVPVVDKAGKEAMVSLVVGSMGEHIAAKPPTSTYASREEADVAIWTIKLPTKGTSFEVPPARTGNAVHRVLYAFDGAVKVDGKEYPSGTGITVHADVAVTVESTDDSGSELLMMQGKPIEDRLVQRGPFMGKSEQDLMDAFNRYRSTQFGQTWPWDREDPMLDLDVGRVAMYADGRKVVKE